VSFDVFLQHFDGGAAADADEAAVLDVLGPLIEERSDGWARLCTSDGGADVYGIDDPPSGLMVNHASGREIWNVLFKVGRAAGFAAMPVGRGTFVFSEKALFDLPDGVPEPTAILTSGDELLRESSRSDDTDLPISRPDVLCSPPAGWRALRSGNRCGCRTPWPSTREAFPAARPRRGTEGNSAPQARFEDVPVYGMSRRTKMLAGSVASVWVKAAVKPPVRTARPM